MDATALGELGDRTRVLNDLKQTEGWQELVRIYEDRREKQAGRLANKILNSRQPLDQREVDRLSGYLAGMKDLLESPDRTERDFEAAVRRATKLGSDQA